MKKSHLTKLALLVLTTLTLGGCLLVPVDRDDGYRPSHDNGRHRGEHRGGHDGRR